MRKLALKKGLLSASPAAAAGQQPASSVQLPSHGPDVEQQFRWQQQQQQQQTARQRQQQQQQHPGAACAGIIAIASVSNGEGSSAASSSANLLAGSAATAAGGGFGDQSGLWGPAGEKKLQQFCLLFPHVLPCSSCCHFVCQRFA
jgi:subtilisin family serine protease